MTPAQVLTLVRQQAVETTAAFWSDDEIYTYMTNGEQILAQRVRCSEATDSSITTVASTREYTLPSTVMSIFRLTWNQVKLKRIDLTDLDEVEGTAYGGVTVTGDPVFYYVFGGLIGLSPVPTSAQTIKIYHMAVVTDLSASSTAFTIKPEYGHYLADYCLYRMFLKDQETGAEAATYRGQWELNLRNAESDWRNRKGLDKYKMVKEVEEYPDTVIGMI